MTTAPAPKPEFPPAPEGMVNMVVDGAHIIVPKTFTVMKACQQAEKEIPHFCFHERLSIAGNCRMCLVEVVGAPKPVASCHWPVAEGMKVNTQSAITIEARKGTMELLLINHPLDCPICDQGGECELQDQAVAYGSDRTHYHEFKRAVDDKEIGSKIKTVMTRCIHCTRCVRFATELAGVEEFGATGRGENMQIGTYVEQALQSELAGNMIDLCPVGALTNKPYAYTARPWELARTSSTDVLDATGTPIHVDTRAGKVMRVLPQDNAEINEEWLTDAARFSTDALHTNRLTTPMLKKGRGHVPCSWPEAFAALQSILAGHTSLEGAQRAYARHASPATGVVIPVPPVGGTGTREGGGKAEHNGTASAAFQDAQLPHNVPPVGGTGTREGGSQAGNISKANITGTHAGILGRLESAETAYAFHQFLTQCLGTPHVESRPAGHTLNVRPTLGSTLRGFETATSVLLVGANPRREAPLLNLRLRRMATKGKVPVSRVGAEADLTYPVTQLGEDTEDLMGALKMKGVLAGERPAIVVSSHILQRPDAHAILTACQTAVTKAGGTLHILPATLGEVTAWAVGVVPAEGGMTTAEILKAWQKGKLQTLWLQGDDTVSAEDVAGGEGTLVYVGTHLSPLAKHADILLPAAAWSEQAGMYMSMETRVVETQAATPPPLQAKETWKIYRALSEHLGEMLPFNTRGQLRGALAALGATGAALGAVSAPSEHLLAPQKLPKTAPSAASRKPFAEPVEEYYQRLTYLQNSPTMHTMQAETGTAKIKKTA